jgi:hypothetical protein
MADNVFSSSLYQLGQYLLNNPQGAGQQPGQAGPQGLPGNMPQKIDTTWTYGAPTNAAAIPTNVAPPPPQQTTTAQAGAVPTSTESFAQPNLPGAQAPPTPQGVQQPSQGGGGGGMGGRGGAGGGAGGTTTGGFFGGGSQNPQNQQMGSALSGITSALSSGLSNAASAIGNVKTMPNIVQGGPIPSINQQAPTLVGRRPQTAFYG